MRVVLVIPFIFFIFLSLGSLAQDDGGCPSSGMTPYDYIQALCMSFLFYEAQRSGSLPADNRIAWRGDSALTDGQDNGLDLTGGYYDAGDHVKFGFPLSYSISVLAWGLVAYPDGYQTAGQTQYARDAIRWGTDYLLKAHSGTNELYGQVGDGDLDHAYWGRPEDMTMQRPSWKIDTTAPGSDLASDTVAALAASYLVFQNVDPTYANELLNFAREMFDFSDQYRDIYTNAIPNADAFYKSWSSYEDEMAYGAAWMYKATGEQYYLDKAIEYVNQYGLLNYAGFFYWDDVTPGIYALLAETTGDQTYINALQQFIEKMINETPYNPGGAIFLQEWGSLRHAANVAFIGMRAASIGINTAQYQAWARSQLDYILGSSGHSFVVGFGVNPPTHCHHRAASCNDPPAPCDYSDMSKTEPNPHVLFGALVGGPTDQLGSWADNRSNWLQTEVGLDYNAGFSGLLAAAIELTVLKD